jgi:hypothetical protein
MVEMERLEATLNYESCEVPPLMLAAIEDVRFNLNIHPTTLFINASLGNMRAQDGVLPEVTPSLCSCLGPRDACYVYQGRIH